MKIIVSNKSPGPLIAIIEEQSIPDFPIVVRNVLLNDGI